MVNLTIEPIQKNTLERASYYVNDDKSIQRTGIVDSVELDANVTNLEATSKIQNLLLKDILEELKELNFFLKYKLGD